MLPPVPPALRDDDDDDDDDVVVVVVTVGTVVLVTVVVTPRELETGCCPAAPPAEVLCPLTLAIVPPAMRPEDELARSLAAVSAGAGADVDVMTVETFVANVVGNGAGGVGPIGGDVTGAETEIDEDKGCWVRVAEDSFESEPLRSEAISTMTVSRRGCLQGRWVHGAPGLCSSVLNSPAPLPCSSLGSLKQCFLMPRALNQRAYNQVETMDGACSEHTASREETAECFRPTSKSMSRPQTSERSIDVLN